MLTDFVDKKLGLGTARTASHCSTVPEAGTLKGWEMGYLKIIHSYIWQLLLVLG